MINNDDIVFVQPPEQILEQVFIPAGNLEIITVADILQREVLVDRKRAAKDYLVNTRSRQRSGTAGVADVDAAEKYEFGCRLAEHIEQAITV